MVAGALEKNFDDTVGHDQQLIYIADYSDGEAQSPPGIVQSPSQKEI